MLHHDQGQINGWFILFWTLYIKLQWAVRVYGKYNNTTAA